MAFSGAEVTDYISFLSKVIVVYLNSINGCPNVELQQPIDLLSTDKLIGNYFNFGYIKKKGE